MELITGKATDNAELEALMKEVDKDGTGGVEFAEFATLMTRTARHGEQVKMKPLEEEVAASEAMEVQAQTEMERKAARERVENARLALGRARGIASQQAMDAFHIFERYEAKIVNLREIFNKFDTGGRGELSKKDLGRAMRSFGLFFQEEDLDALMRDLDSDGSGLVNL